MPASYLTSPTVEAWAWEQRRIAESLDELALIHAGVHNDNERLRRMREAAAYRQAWEALETEIKLNLMAEALLDRRAELASLDLEVEQTRAEANEAERSLLQMRAAAH